MRGSERSATLGLLSQGHPLNLTLCPLPSSVSVLPRHRPAQGTPRCRLSRGPTPEAPGRTTMLGDQGPLAGLPPQEPWAEQRLPGHYGPTLLPVLQTCHPTWQGCRWAEPRARGWAGGAGSPTSPHERRQRRPWAAGERGQEHSSLREPHAAWTPEPPDSSPPPLTVRPLPDSAPPGPQQHEQRPQQPGWGQARWQASLPRSPGAHDSPAER